MTFFLASKKYIEYILQFIHTFLRCIYYIFKWVQINHSGLIEIQRFSKPSLHTYQSLLPLPFVYLFNLKHLCRVHMSTYYKKFTRHVSPERTNDSLLNMLAQLQHNERRVSNNKWMRGSVMCEQRRMIPLPGL